MTRLRMLLAPLVCLLVGATAGARSEGSETTVHVSGWHPERWRQVRIEQHFSIRITPGIAAMPPAMLGELVEDDRIEHGGPRRVNKCLAINTIAAVRPGDGDELLLFLHDQRIISVRLEKRCSARDFYSGFYLMRNPDGAICAGRDVLQARSGANCKVKRLTELVPAGYRRFP